MAQKELIYYKTANGKEPFRAWLKSLKDKVTMVRVERRLDKVEEGHYGDYKSVGKGVYELRFDFGAGYRAYFAEDGKTIVLLLNGGDKGSQSRDIKTAQRYLQDYKENKP